MNKTAKVLRAIQKQGNNEFRRSEVGIDGALAARLLRYGLIERTSNKFGYRVIEGIKDLRKAYDEKVLAVLSQARSRPRKLLEANKNMPDGHQLRVRVIPLDDDGQVLIKIGNKTYVGYEGAIVARKHGRSTDGR